ncbi:hypothetical protein BpHYR1_031119 [Brachionus plicatilis]|uniref:Uncharacterized protein n=1 Tax=Brachionus plicatilis TaxID=10195 RepID=A0A3M7RRP9_BRAPC|nr:hypothetical protein BpHYR1_031119 [Brachionus plicatilis]
MTKHLPDPVITAFIIQVVDFGLKSDRNMTYSNKINRAIKYLRFSDSFSKKQIIQLIITLMFNKYY